MVPAVATRLPPQSAVLVGVVGVGFGVRSRGFLDRSRREVSRIHYASPRRRSFHSAREEVSCMCPTCLVTEEIDLPV